MRKRRLRRPLKSGLADVMMRVPKARHEHPLRGKERKGRQSEEGEQGEEAKLGLARRAPKSPADARLTLEGKGGVRSAVDPIGS